jgi:hypothetical protein
MGKAVTWKVDNKVKVNRTDSLKMSLLILITLFFVYLTDIPIEHYIA